MKTALSTFAFALFLLGNSAHAANGGTIYFHGAIVNTPCSITAETWLNYAQHPASYQVARNAPASPSCAGASSTQSVKLSRYTAQTVSGTEMSASPAKAIVTVVYN